MKNVVKKISVLLALVLVVSMLGSVAVFAEGENAAVDEVLTGDTAQGEEGKTDGADGTENKNEVTPAATPEPAPYIVGYDVKSDTMGDFYNVWDVADITVKFVDEWAANPENISAEAWENDTKPVKVRVNATSFKKIEGTIEKQDGIFVATFKDVEYIGGSNQFTFELIYEGSNKPRAIQTLTQEIVQCSDYIPPEETSAPIATPAPTAEPDLPKIMVKDFTFGGTSVEAGKEFTLDLTLFTTSGNTNLNDVMVGLNFGDSKNVSLASGSLNTYVGAMAPGATRHITYKVVTDATMDPGAISITVQLSSKNGADSSYPISIPVTQPIRFDITNMEAPEVIMMGEEGYMSVTFVNKGKSEITNLSAEIQGENLANPGQNQFLGNIAPGTENSVDFSVMAAAEGVINGKVILSFEDAKGEVQTLEKEFSCTVEAMPEFDPNMGYPDGDMSIEDPMMGGDVEKTGMPWWGWLRVAAAAGGVVVAVVVVLKKKKAKKQALLEDDDEDI